MDTGDGGRFGRGRVRAEHERRWETPLTSRPGASAREGAGWPVSQTEREGVRSVGLGSSSARSASWAAGGDEAAGQLGQKREGGSRPAGLQFEEADRGRGVRNQAFGLDRERREFSFLLFFISKPFSTHFQKHLNSF
jgi:hypothetical protein